jgi:hypothetical protein
MSDAEDDATWSSDPCRTLGFGPVEKNERTILNCYARDTHVCQQQRAVEGMCFENKCVAVVPAVVLIYRERRRYCNSRSMPCSKGILSYGTDMTKNVV